MNKMTLLSITFRGRRYSLFVQAQYDSQGRARVSQPMLDRILNRIGVQRGDTYSIG